MSDALGSTTQRPGVVGVLRAGLTGLLLAAMVNGALFLIGSTFTFPATALSQLGEPVTLMPVLIVTAGAGVVAIIGYFVLTRFLGMAWVRRVMWGVTVLILLAMAYTPFTISNVPVAEIIILEIMHLVAAVPVWFLTRL